MSSKTILVTGGTGYIGSHTIIELLNAGYDVINVDNGINSNPSESIKRLEEITGKKLKKNYSLDLGVESELRKVFQENSDIVTVIHFAALKAVGESVHKPLEYYTNNVAGTLVLLRVMKEFNVKNFVFSSSATVYGVVDDCPESGMTEDRSINANSPYGTTKVFVEYILRDLKVAQPDWNIAILRYFNPVGAHSSGRIGEDPKGIPNNLVPYILQVMTGRREFLSIYGDDYETKDGTGIRDYIHVVDLAKGHIAAAKFLEGKNGVCEAINLGTGRGMTVFDVLNSLKKVSGKEIPHKVMPRRAGDVTIYLADVSKAKKLLGWSAELTLDEMCADAWNWARLNPEGLSSS
ncbi:UDP-glucose 4-epimerase [Planoprotostelium fungivorum]|uniref:UDP-glucose 4-epimerase n=1 Tax=Planoprotostelium fungivorum TaxID=1890364 RepID=A0A2P6MQT3_9EUKA|nr:UDP-glucose 4-epimerase [Planoprotostelium fungivorum]